MKLVPQEGPYARIHSCLASDHRITCVDGVNIRWPYTSAYVEISKTEYMASVP